MEILCLHGKFQCGEVFSQKMRALLKKMKKEFGENVRFTFLDGPFELPLRPGETVKMRSWNEGKDNWQSAMKLVSKSFEKTRFDGIIAFSQGVCVACLCCISDKLNKSLKFVVTAGGVSPSSMMMSTISLKVPSLHFIGEKDQCVSSTITETMIKYFKNPKVHRHERGHILPQRASEIRVVLDFIKNQIRIKGYDIIPEEQTDELEALESIFGDEYCEIVHDGSDSRYPPTVKIRVFDPDSFDEKQMPSKLLSLLLSISLKSTFVRNYPDKEIPHLELKDSKKLFLRLAAMRSSSRYKLDHTDAARELQSECLLMMRRKAQDSLGGAMLFDLIESIREWILELVERLSNGNNNDDDDEEEEEEKKNNDFNIEDLLNDDKDMVPWWEEEDQDDEKNEKMMNEASLEAASHQSIFRPASQRGSWTNFTIGLVGKPSAGKSTFFNGVCSVLTRDGREQESSVKARVGAFPFTTIEPNVGFGFCAFPQLDFKTRLQDVDTGKVKTRYGRSADGKRLIRVRVKDVAGLVPGAYRGRGHGNAFLNDLTDADVLVHVVDVSATTDISGNSSGETNAEVGDPCADIQWVRSEIHRWIFANVKAKWATIRRRPTKLHLMFTGYHCTTEYVDEVLKRTNMSLENLLNWDASQLHRIVAHFLRIRFPILLALNKCDLPNASKHVKRVREMFPLEPVTVLSARAECKLQELQKERRVKYVTGDNCFVNLNNDDRLNSLTSFLKLNHGTGVLRTINRAVSLREPLLVYPVSSAKSCRSVTSDDDLLFDCLLMRPGSTVEDLYNVLKRLSLLKGDYVRGETRDGVGQIRPLRKSERLVSNSSEGINNNNIVAISVNKKISWQKKQPSSSSSSSSNIKSNLTTTSSITTSSKDRLMKRLLKGNKRQGKTKGGRGQGQL